MTIEININGEVFPTTLLARAKPTEKEYEQKWELYSDEYEEVKITFTEGAGILHEGTLDIPNGVMTSRKEIEILIDELLKEDLENRQDGVEDAPDSEEDEPQPYDYNKIRIRSDRWALSVVHQLINEYGVLELNPDFQRYFVWDYKRKSRLIESLMLKIPVPAFYLAETEEGKYQVVDGLQRLTTITEFMDNKFALKYLEYLKNEKDAERNQEGKYFKDEGKKKGILPEFQTNILLTQITVNIIEARSPAKVKFDVFRRVNTGGKPLNNQEIRNCLANTKTRGLLNELANSEAFVEATGGSVKTTRMQAQELVLRFIGFWYERILKDERWVYKGSMTDFLDDAIELLNKDKGKYNEKIRTVFYKAMNNAQYLFGKYAFRKCLVKDLEPDARKQLINKSLFTTWSVVLSQYAPLRIASKAEQVSFAKKLAEKLEKDRDYFDKVSYKTNDKDSLKTAFEVTEEIVETLKLDKHE